MEFNGQQYGSDGGAAGYDPEGDFFLPEGSALKLNRKKRPERNCQAHEGKVATELRPIAIHRAVSTFHDM
ncbi:hypothetical protein FHX14_005945 [Rhizobium sp. BK619]|nr:hypothetical protein [Rhizobium sp. BK619]